jgi:hypothetical protein
VPGNITAIDPIYAEASGSKTPSRRLEGASITVRATEGMTAQWLQRVIDCQIARRGALALSPQGSPPCSAEVTAVVTSVSETRTGFSIALRSDDMKTAREVLCCARGSGGRSDCL